jgi:cytosine/adenosine deaminase-related metal-dependent hydrolase
VGVRLVAAVDADEKNHDTSIAKAAIAENVRFAQKCAAKDDGMAAAMMGLSAPDALPTLLGEAVSAARKAEMGFHLVLSGSPESRRHIAEKAALRPGSVAVLAAALDDEERALLRDLQVMAVTTPRDDAARGMAPPPARGLARNLVLGGLDVLGERDAFVIARGPALRDEKIALWRLLSNGWDLAAGTLDRTFGRWNEGAPADLVVIDEPVAAPLTPATLPAHVVGARAKHVRHVVVNGKTIVRDGKLVTVDLRSVRSDAGTAAASAWARAKR